MQPFDTIPKTVSTPQVSFDQHSMKMEIQGDSYPENSFQFYAPIALWVKETVVEGNSLNLDVNVSYMNSSSTKCMLDLLDILEDAHARGVAVSITWRYDRENPRSLDLAEEFREEVTLPFSIVAYNE